MESPGCAAGTAVRGGNTRAGGRVKQNERKNLILRVPLLSKCLEQYFQRFLQETCYFGLASSATNRLGPALNCQPAVGLRPERTS